LASCDGDNPRRKEELTTKEGDSKRRGFQAFSYSSSTGQRAKDWGKSRKEGSCKKEAL